MCPPASPCEGAFVVQFPAHNACIFCMETPLRERSGGHTGTAPTVSFGWIAFGRLVSFGQIARGRLVSFGQIARGRLVTFGWIARGWFGLLVGKTVHMNQHHRCCTFVSPGLIEHSEIYPGESRGGEPMPSALYLLKSICMRGNHLLRMVMMCDEKKYNPQGGSPLVCIVTQGRLRCTCQPCAIESITPMG